MFNITGEVGVELIVSVLRPLILSKTHHCNLIIQEGEQGKVPFLIIQQRTQHPSKKQSQRPAVICLHSTGNSKETMRPFMKVWKIFLHRMRDSSSDFLVTGLLGGSG